MLKLEIISAVQESLEKFEPWIQNTSIKADPNPEYPNKILVQIKAKTRSQAPIKIKILVNTMTHRTDLSKIALQGRL